MDNNTPEDLPIRFDEIYHETQQQLMQPKRLMNKAELMSVLEYPTARATS
jgi:hypothetical protein